MVKHIEVGTKVGKLTVVSGPEIVYSWHFSKKLGRETRYTSYRQQCRCDCGSLTKVLVGNLLKETRSCGCLKRAQTATRNRIANTTHGLSRSSEYRIWLGMKQRCHNENDPAFGRYGGRGIAVCEEWRATFPAFFAHIGPRPSRQHSVDRMDNDRGYEPGNVRWATAKEQQNNTRVQKARSPDVSIIRV